MEFFKKLSECAVLDLKLKITRKGDKYTVGVFPEIQNEILQNKSKPFLITGTAQELDNEFFNHINPAMDSIVKVSSNIDSFTESLKKTEDQEKGKSAANKQKIKEKSRPGIKKPADKTEDDDQDENNQEEGKKAEQGTIFN